MRAIMAVFASVTMLLVGVMAISRQAQQVRPTLNTTAQNESYNASVAVFEGVTQTGGQGIVWFGIAAIILIALGFLVMAARGGR